ncbi:MAG: hypothetical protein M1308_14585 [Actinobacteria bacterium]|nr:hypothetical protein [Actinomycetota bacterium]
MSEKVKMKTIKGIPPIYPPWLIKLMLKLKVKMPMPKPLFVKPDNWDELTPKERRDLRFDNWISGAGTKFISNEAEVSYKERASLFRDAFDLEKNPKRIPMHPFLGLYSLRRVGLNPKAIFYKKWKEAASAHIQFFLDFEPDSSYFALLNSGKALELLDCKVMKWPGGELSEELPYQYVEEEFMKADEYGHLLRNPSDCMMRKVVPRMFKALDSMEMMPNFVDFYSGSPVFFMSFALPQLQKNLQTIKKAAELILSIAPAQVAILRGPEIQGFPQFYGSGIPAPFDALSDLLRSTQGIMTDIYRHPEELIEACDLFASIIIENPLFEFGSSPFVFIPLHKGSDCFMSTEQYKKFYWPSLKKVMLSLVKDGLVPVPFAEGSYNKRLEVIADFPKGDCIWYFDQTDMKQAKKILGNVCTIMGNVPASLMATGTSDQMTTYCKDLLETCAKDGNFILSNGCQIDEAQEENVLAMINSAKEYKV